MPGVLFIPEETDILDYATVKPLQDNWSSGIIPIPAAALFMWPNASNYQLLQFGFGNHTPGDFVPLIQAGDTLRADVWYNSSSTWDVVRQAYLMAGPQGLSTGPVAS